MAQERVPAKRIFIGIPGGSTDLDTRFHQIFHDFSFKLQRIRFPVQHHALGAEAAVDDVDLQIKAVVKRGKQCLVAQMRVSHKNKLCIWSVSADLIAAARCARAVADGDSRNMGAMNDILRVIICVCRIIFIICDVRQLFADIIRVLLKARSGKIL